MSNGGSSRGYIYVIGDRIVFLYIINFYTLYILEASENEGDFTFDFFDNFLQQLVN